VKSELFISVSVVLVTGIRVAAIDSEGIRAIGLLVSSPAALERIHARRIVFRADKIFCAVIIFLGVGIGPE